MDSHSVDQQNLFVLYQAANYVENNCSTPLEQEHGYASTLPAPIDIPVKASSRNQYSSGPFSEYLGGSSSSAPSSFIHPGAHYRSASGSSSNGGNSNSRRRQRTTSRSKVVTNRTTHNELEKNRRAHLRTCLDNLKLQVPLGAESNKHTTLGLLNKAREYIANLEAEYRGLDLKKQSLKKEKIARLAQLSEMGFTRECMERKRRSISESSLGSDLSVLSHASSDSSPSESDDMDVLSSGTASTASSPPSDIEHSWLGEPSLTGEVIATASCLSIKKGAAKAKATRGVSCDRYRKPAARKISISDGSSDGGQMVTSFRKNLLIDDSLPSRGVSPFPKVELSHQVKGRLYRQL